MDRPTSSLAGAWARLQELTRRHQAQLRQCIRVTVAALLSFALGEMLNIPLVLWVVMTALIVTQISVGGSLKATLDYFVGTLGGAIYGGAIAAILPHHNDIALAGVLAIAVAPLALLAAIKPSFRVAPITAVIVLLGLSAQGGPITSAIDRVIEVALGGVTALVVSLLILPARAHLLAFEAAARMLEGMAEVLPSLFAGFSHNLEIAAIRDMQTGIGQALAQLDPICAEAQRERQTLDPAEPDLGPLQRTLLRLRHDLVMLGRAAMVPLPDVLQPRLSPPLARVATAAADYMRACAAALRSRRPPPPLEATEAALDAYAAEIAAIRRDAVMRDMPAEVVERIFALGFALEQLHQHFGDLGRCVTEYAQVARDPSGRRD